MFWVEDAFPVKEETMFLITGSAFSTTSIILEASHPVNNIEETNIRMTNREDLTNLFFINFLLNFSVNLLKCLFILI